MEKHTKLTVGALAMASLALIGLAVGCGSKQGERSSATVAASQDVVAASAAGAVAGSQGSSGPPAMPTGEDKIAVSSDSLPPEVAASIADTLVTPGAVIEITAQGSPDVVEVTLADGIGKRQKFAYDPAADLWRASYRVPMKLPTERLGLSVTAKNDIDRWRRVWVFLGVGHAGANQPATQDTAK